ncbi:MAG: sigma-70 family RNA polymerase sigma factor [Actinobacteria bacterium]|nr:MAG: sigma-70 family RNA polymerase sigma factor [Actinomycetota bacterium]
MNVNSEQGMRTDMEVEPTDARELVLRVISQHADSLLRTARRHSLCADDAQDAYQRTMEIFVRRAATLDPELAHKWVHTVCKHEAMAVRAQRQQLVSSDEPDLDREEARHLPSPEEQLVSFDRLRRSAEALQRLKPQELRALWLKAEGFSYAEICEQTGWTHTKVNRCITEGRRAFLTRYARIEGGAECERWLPLLSAIVDGEATPEQLLEIRPHLRNCTACRATVRELHETSAPLAALFPVALAPAAVGEHKSSLFARIYDAVAGGIHHRAAAAAFKVQAATEAAPTGKLAAIAASAAAIGSGAVVAHSRVPSHAAGAAQARPVAQHTAPPLRTAVASAPGRTTTTAAKPRARVQHHARREFKAPTTPRTEFTSASAASAPPPAPASSVVSSGSAEPSASRREFASEFGD